MFIKANRHDRYAVAVIVGEKIVGHVPREISRLHAISLGIKVSPLEK